MALAVMAMQQAQVDACTAIAVTRGASVDNSTLIAHTDDAGGGASDLRLVRVPAQDHKPGSKRAVYNFNGGYPRVVAPDRGPHYQPVTELETGETQPYSAPMGYIPQVEHTYAYFDQDYGVMNEVQLSIGESTCGAKTVGWPLNVPGGKNLFGIAELTKVALERCATARCAVDIMGSLAEEYGFYSEDSGDMAKPDYGDSAEALVVGDKLGEVWVFHVMTGKDHAGAVWAAQRVPDGHVTVIANGFTIRELDLSQPDWFMASSNVHSLAEDMGWWDPKGDKPFDFTAAYGFADKDAIGPLYTGRRVWRVFDVLAPSLQLDARLGSFSQYATYPFSIKPDRLVEAFQIMDLLRDHYEGTRYDMTKGLAAGPFGAPFAGRAAPVESLGLGTPDLHVPHAVRFCPAEPKPQGPRCCWWRCMVRPGCASRLGLRPVLLRSRGRPEVVLAGSSEQVPPAVRLVGLQLREQLEPTALQLDECRHSR